MNIFKVAAQICEGSGLLYYQKSCITFYGAKLLKPCQSYSLMDTAKVPDHPQSNGHINHFTPAWEKGESPNTARASTPTGKRGRTPRNKHYAHDEIEEVESIRYIETPRSRSNHSTLVLDMAAGKHCAPGTEEIATLDDTGDLEVEDLGHSQTAVVDHSALVIGAAAGSHNLQSLQNCLKERFASSEDDLEHYGKDRAKLGNNRLQVESESP